MARGKTLKAALDRHKGVDYKLEHQKKLQKKAEKLSRKKVAEADVESDEEFDDDDDDDVEGPEGIDINALEAAVAAAEKADKAAGIDPTLLEEQEIAADAADELEAIDGEAEGYVTDESEDASEEELEEDESSEEGGVQLDGLDEDSDSDEDDEEEDEEEQEADDIPLSDIESLASEDKADVIPHQRLTINNTTALQRALKSFALPSDLPFSATQTITTLEPVEIPDIEDDLNRELSFYKQSLDAVKDARALLKKEGVPFSRPADYFAEMVKSEEQMGKVRQKQVDEAARKKASAEARRQRDLKKFGKAVQTAKLQERDKAKRDTLEKIKSLKRKRQGAELNANENDMFDVALEDAAETEKADRAARRAKSTGAPPNKKRQKKDEKYGFGGKKRFAKSNDAKSSGDMRDYSVKRMKGKAGGKPQRPGKSRRARMP